MAGPEELERFDCACGALLVRASEKGFELYCRRCDRRVVVPYEEVQGKKTFFRFLGDWIARIRRP